jgi:hypothetical protein
MIFCVVTSLKIGLFIEPVPMSYNTYSIHRQKTLLEKEHTFQFHYPLFSSPHLPPMYTTVLTLR